MSTADVIVPQCVLRICGGISVRDVSALPGGDVCNGLYFASRTWFVRGGLTVKSGHASSNDAQHGATDLKIPGHVRA